MKMMKFVFDTESRKIELDGKPLQHVYELSLYCSGGKQPMLEIKQDAEVEICGTLVLGEVKELKCECGYYVGKFIDYCGDVICPSCGRLIKD